MSGGHIGWRGKRLWRTLSSVELMSTHAVGTILDSDGTVWNMSALIWSIYTEARGQDIEKEINV